MDLHQAFMEHRVLAAREAILQAELGRTLATVAQFESELSQVRLELKALEERLEKKLNGAQKDAIEVSAPSVGGEPSLVMRAKAWISKRKGREWSLTDLIDGIGVGAAYAPKLVHRLLENHEVQRIRRGVYRTA